ncbi:MULTISPECIES: helix-turn-helix transcriptional regulator [unclassified Rhizobium]|uniref:helix-turn-helix transcriptional regulator n=1 Tax=unclassified Rhizobium TaxID=2613769 RepID=UPI0007E9CD8C|nr:MULTISPECIES: LuxR family transcriptional regulator [unclassified Rhizobium]ANM14893.1 LuxR family transcriptional regulator protein [Rhizobium sp. N324]ANM21281.1 LuxR family transcriptional regulator protein [Rhizobium sp. N541]ANM27653.1 LuxR family transcriptional regulator protein [Rhizobium sp. N941]OYC99996.1 LuxR family transcriptional regulator protein [Rhizobium sp. N4311]
MGCASIESLCHFRDLSEVPAHRQLRNSDLLEQLRKAVDFRYIAVGGLDLEGYRIGRGRSIDTDMPPAYIDTYFGEKLGLSDPLVVQSLERSTPLTEEEAFDILAPTQRLRYLLRSYEIGRRIQIPLSRNGIIYGGVCFTREKPFTASEQELLVFFAEPLHRAITKPLMDRFAAGVLRLTSGELRCLELAGKGLTSEEISGASDYQTETINSYLKSATKKLGAANRAHAIAEAIRRQLIS